MSYEGLMVALALAAATVIWVAAPLLRRGSKHKHDLAEEQRQEERLLVFYEQVLGNIRDLEEDHSTGKLANEDYESEREAWVQRGIQVLKTLDRLREQHGVPLSGDGTGAEESLDSAIEEAVAQYRRKAGSHRAS